MTKKILLVDAKFSRLYYTTDILTWWTEDAGEVQTHYYITAVACNNPLYIVGTEFSKIPVCREVAAEMIREARETEE